MDAEMKRRLVEAQRNEITEYHVYRALVAREKNAANRDVLERIAADERKHYDFWAERTGERPGPRRGKRWWDVTLARLLGLTFAVKLMEHGEEGAQVSYGEIAETYPEAEQVLRDEEEHEDELMAMIDEERLRYMGSVVLGLSDALVELTGALAGLTLALRNSDLIALTGLITGIAAALSMGASEYLSTKAEDQGAKTPGKAALYTGGTYLVTVGVLILPFLLLAEPLWALAITLAAALGIILLFTGYLGVARDLPIGRRFLEMAGLSLGVAAVSFGIGFVLRLGLGVEV